MNRRLFFNTLVILAMLAGVLPPAAARPAAQPGASVVVRLSPEAYAAAPELSPIRVVDYGSFIWLEMPAEQLPALDASGVAYELQPHAAKIGLENYAFDTRQGEPAIPADLRAAPAAGEPGLHLVQFVGPTHAAWLDDLEKDGLQVLQYLPQHAYLVWGTPDQVQSARAAPAVRWSGAFHPAYKLASSLTGRSGPIENVNVLIYDDGRVRQTIQAIQDLGGRYVQDFPMPVLQRGQLVDAIFALDAAALPAVARLPNVFHLDYASPRPGLDDEVSDQIIAGHYTGGVPYTGYRSWLTAKGIDGSGVRFADVDTGLDTNNSATAHADIRGRIAAFVDYTGGSTLTDTDGHGTHTGGTIAGNATLNVTDPNGFLFGLGVAPGAQIVVQNGLMGASWPPSGGWQQFSKDSVVNGAVGSSNSWYTGASGAQGYSSACVIHDRMVRDANLDTTTVAEPLIMVFSAGNNGPGASTITEPKEAKNLIVVGASENYRPDNPLGPDCGASGNIDGVVYFSSRGPCLDGRQAPTLSAPGSDVASLRSYTGSYSGCGQIVGGHPDYVYMSGTSMACPHVSGGVALLTQWWRSFNGGANPSPAMAKALLVNGAVDMGAPDIPNNNEGWGRMNLDNVIKNGQAMIYHDQDHLLTDTGQTWTLRAVVADPSRPLKVSLAWSDAPGAAGGNAWVNDLDLQVTVGGQVYKGNVFSNGWSVTGGSADYRNNLENVYVQNPSGVVDIRVSAANIAGDGVPYNGDSTDQDFALVVYNVMKAAGHLDGVVHDGTLGTGLAGAGLRVVTGTQVYAATTQPSGYYTLTLAPDTYQVSAWKYGYTLETLTGVTVVSNTVTTRHITLTQTSPYSLTGQVTDSATGAPLASTVAVLGPFGEPLAQTTTPQSSGRYTLTLYGGPYTLTAQARLHAPGAAFVNLAANTVKDMALVATTTQGLLWGRVTNQETAGPVAGATIQVTPGLTSTTSRADGYYELLLPAGSYAVTVSAPLYSTIGESGVSVPTSNLVQRDYALPTAHLTLPPPGDADASVVLGGQVTETLILSNTGSGTLEFEFQEVSPGFTPLERREAGGGPDPFGYIYRDSNEGDGPLYEWIDATDGTPLNLIDDGAANVTMPFPFTFYGTTSTALRVSNNGGLLFNATSGSLSTANGDLATTTSNNIIVPFWDDIDDETGNVYYKTIGIAPDRRFVVEWYNRPHYKSGGGVGMATFELILYEGTNNIKFQYQDTVFGDPSNPSWDLGGSATSGIRGSGTNYLQYSYNTASLANELAICFQYPGSAPCDLRDIPWLTVSPVSGTIAAGNALTIDVGYDAGGAEQPGAFTAALRMLTNDPAAQPYTDYPVTMTVQPPASWGKLRGVITSNRPGGPLAGALVKIISGTSTVYSVTVGADGAYLRWLPQGSYTVSVSAAGYLPDEQSVALTGSGMTTHDVELRLDAPEISVAPLALTSTQYIDEIVTRTLRITNSGDGELTFRFLELPGSFRASLSEAGPSGAESDGPAEVEAAVQQALAQAGQADFWVEFGERPDLSPAYGMDWQARGRFVYDTLRQAAERSQAQARAYLDEAGLTYTPHWLINALYVKAGTPAALEAMTRLSNVTRIRAPRVLPVPEPVRRRTEAGLPIEAPEWGLNIIQAPATWALYTRGEGIVVGNIDTGVRYTHRALVGHYRGNLGGSFNHNFNWYDPQGATAPVDDNGHGSHTMGIMVGDDGGSNQIGVAPGARWIAADGCDGSSCPDADLLSSGEWMLAPCPLGVAPGSPTCNPDQRPHVVNNSWGDCETSTNTFFETWIDAWRAAGIFTAFSNGNTSNCGYSAPFCNSMGNPARHYQVTGVGATTASDAIADFSLWGPTDDADPRLPQYATIKPEVSAPGENIRSAVKTSDTSYEAWDGTSMAAPHVAGAAALMLAVNPGLIGQNDMIEDVLKSTADPKPYNTNCGNEGPGNVPNNAFGWGRINVRRAVEQALALADIPWVSEQPSSGRVPAGTTALVTVTFDASGLRTGVYSGTLRILHNDPVVGNVNVPLTMTVLMPPPKLDLAKRAGQARAEVGLPLTYTVVVTNSRGDATGVVISDTLPPNVQFAWASHGGALLGGQVVWGGLSIPMYGKLGVVYGVTVTCVSSGTLIVNDDYQVHANEWPTHTYGAPVTVTAIAQGVQADLGFPTPVILNHPVAFSNLSQNATAYEWAFGDGGTSTLALPTHAYTNLGAYTVTLTATNLCNADTRSRALTVENYAVSLAPSADSRQADPGQVVTYTLRVTNTGTLPDTFNMSLGSRTWNTTLSTGSVGPLLPNASAVVSVYVTIPATALAGSQDQVLVQATSATDPRAPRASAGGSLTTRANAFYGVALTPATAAKSGSAGGAVDYTLRVANAGNIQDTFVLTYTGNAWPVSLSRTEITLGAFAGKNILVRVSLPRDAMLGENDKVNVIATSRGDGARSATSVLTTTVSSAHSVRLEPQAAGQPGDPGQVVTYTLRMTNTGSSQDTFELSYADNAWGVDLPVTQVTLAAGEGTDVLVRVTIPATAAGGASDTVTIQATSTTYTYASDTALLTTTANARYGVTLDPPAGAQAGDPGQTMTYTLRLTNTGNAPDTFYLSYAGNTWAVELPVTQTALAAGVGTDVAVRVTIPATASGGASDTVTITATSKADAAVSDASVLTTAVNRAYGVTLDPPIDAQTGDPGQVVTYTLRLTNTGNAPDTFDLSYAGNAWVVSLPVTQTTLAAGEGTDVIVRVTVPTGALVGDSDTVVITAASQHQATTSDSSTLTTTAGAVYGVTLNPPADARTGEPGQVVTYTLRLTNTGNAQDTFDLSYTGNAWVVSLPVTQTTLAAGAGIDVLVRVTIPAGALAGDSDVVVVTAASQHQAAVVDSSTLTTAAGGGTYRFYMPFIKK